MDAYAYLCIYFSSLIYNLKNVGPPYLGLINVRKKVWCGIPKAETGDWKAYQNCPYIINQRSVYSSYEQCL
jgi:hypothetical protein